MLRCEGTYTLGSQAYTEGRHTRRAKGRTSKSMVMVVGRRRGWIEIAVYGPSYLRLEIK